MLSAAVCTPFFYSSHSGCLNNYYFCANARIGITSEDLKNTIEKTLGGAGVALSSPRLVIPAVIFGMSALSDHFQNNFFSFEVRAPFCYCTRFHSVGRQSKIYLALNTHIFKYLFLLLITMIIV